MSKRYQGGVLGAGFNPLQAPNAPTIGTATAGNTTASVAFTAPANVGGSPITSFAVQSTPDGVGAAGSSSPITVSGLTNGTAYTFRVTALNSYGPSLASAASNSVTPIVPTVGQQAFTTAGTFSFVAPAGVTSVSVVAVGGGGGGGGGGALAYKNTITVVPGISYTVVVGAPGVSTGAGGAGTNGGNSSFTAGFGSMTAGGGIASNPAAGGVPSGTYDAGYSGGQAASGIPGYSGGGAAGYAGNGGSSTFGGFNPGSGGSGAGGEWPYSGGGGVGLLGQGASGTSASQGGSGGTNGTGNQGFPHSGGTYGGGGPGNPAFSPGGSGAVRIIYPGTSRSFPSTNTGDL